MILVLEPRASSLCSQLQSIRTCKYLYMPDLTGNALDTIHGCILAYRRKDLYTEIRQCLIDDRSTLSLVE